MPRQVRRRSPWPRRFMMMTAILAVVIGALGFGAMSKQNFALAFPLFITVVVLILFEIVLMAINNRQA